MKYRTLLAMLLAITLLSGCALPGQLLYRLNVEETAGPVSEEAPVAAPVKAPAATALEGRWEGTLSVAGLELEIAVTFTGGSACRRHRYPPAGRPGRSAPQHCRGSARRILRDAPGAADRRLRR